LRINFDVTFPHIPCSLLSLDAMDVSGSHQLDVSHHIKKKPIDKNGLPVGLEQKHELGHVLTEADIKAQNETAKAAAAALAAGAPPPPAKIDPTKVAGYCGPCYGAEQTQGECCNTCDEVRAAYRVKGWALGDLARIEQCVAAGQTGEEMSAELARGDGCNMYGYLEVNKVAGNFHFAPGKSFQHAHMHVHDLAAFAAAKFNVSHRVNRLSFGDEFPGIVNPLDGVAKSLPFDASEGGGMFMYYAKVVPTSYNYISGASLATNQFSVTEHFRRILPREGQGLPGVFVFYELSPIMVKFTEHRSSFAHFLTQLCAILGGVFTVAGMVDRVVYSGWRRWGPKMQIGKHT